MKPDYEKAAEVLREESGRYFSFRNESRFLASTKTKAKVSGTLKETVTQKYHLTKAEPKFQGRSPTVQICQILAKTNSGNNGFLLCIIEGGSGPIRAIITVERASSSSNSWGTDFFFKRRNMTHRILRPSAGRYFSFRNESRFLASTKTKAKGSGALAAVDATVHRSLAERFHVSGFPTLKYFADGEEKYTVPHLRSEQKILEFMHSPEAPPPPEPAWEEKPSSVLHLLGDDFRETLKKKKHALVMFYA
ncbi:unnamed protein product, partial [Ranitomeya imitator]